uniref:Small ribosomal subunit protein mS26 n=1 Tax=Alona affinis TaxID=381656 RepID=A0A9N6WPE4_9CRUS|nr:EOG090X0FQ9 [Alona affinis]
MFTRNAGRFLVTSMTNNVPSRGKRNWVRKPLGTGLAKSKMFKVPVKRVLPDDEAAEIKRLYDNYRCQMKSLRQYFFEESCRAAQTGDTAQLKLRLENEEHARLMEENELENQKTAALREIRLRAQAEETQKKVMASLIHAEKEKEMHQAEFEAFLELQKGKPIIQRGEIQRAIEEALANEVDLNFAIDLDGYVYRGKVTDMSNVPEEKRERLQSS